MEFKTTRKDVKNGYEKIIYVGYCALQRLLKCESRIAYTTRAEGWGADIYDFGNVAIVTGYAPFGNIHPKHEINEKYEAIAKTIIDANPYDWKVQKTVLRDLITVYINEVTE